jgi:DUF4097 and DUF4098 domain-containing protein YvlB
MAEQVIPQKEITRLEIHQAGGALFLNGWNREEIKISCLSEGDQVKEKGQLLTIDGSDDIMVHLPYSLEVSIKSIAGDASIKGIKGPIEISAAGGDLSLTDISSVTVETIGGDLIASHIQGDLKVNKIGGSALAENISGQISLQKVGGDIQLVKVSGGMEAKAGGNARLSFNPVPWQAYRIESGGDISASIPDDSAADLSMKSKGADITLILGEHNIKLKEQEHKMQLGDGGPAIMLQAAGKIFLTGEEYTWVTNLKMNAEELEKLAREFSSQTTQEIKTHLGNLEEELQASLSGLSSSLDSMGISEESLKDLAARIEESGHLAAQKAEMAAIKAQAKVERQLAKARQQALKAKSKMQEFDLGKFLDLQEEKRSVSEEERLMILKMLQEKKISPQDADGLLKALEGKKKP